jgi:hypothetical protein
MTETARGGKRKSGDFAHGVKLRKKVFWQASRRKRCIEKRRRSAALFPRSPYVVQTPTTTNTRVFDPEPCSMKLHGRKWPIRIV